MGKTIEKELKKLRFKNVKIQSLHYEIINLRAGIVKGQSFDGMPKSASDDNRTEEMNIKAIDRISELYQEIEQLYKEQEELIKAIESLDDPVENIVMRLFYIDGMTWNEVEAKLRYSRGAIQKIRKSAFGNLSKNVNKVN